MSKQCLASCDVLYLPHRINSWKNKNETSNVQISIERKENTSVKGTIAKYTEIPTIEVAYLTLFVKYLHLL